LTTDHAGGILLANQRAVPQAFTRLAGWNRGVVKLLGRRAHGFVDYGTAAVELALAAALPAKRRTKLLLVISAVNAAALGALTKYELGLVRVVPMRVHLALDGLFAASFVLAAATFDEQPPARAALAGLGAVGACVAAVTDPDRA
jgi:hypothetical protein